MNSLFNHPIEREEQSILFEQYKLYVQSANLTSSLRSQSNTFFLTINTALVGFLAAVLEFSGHQSVSYWIAFACVAGVLLSISWLMLIRAYRSLNSGRFAVIHELEKELPARIYEREWEIILAKRPHKSRYIRQTYIEQVIPMAFCVLYIAFLVVHALFS